jgi:hypothetical protein
MIDISQSTIEPDIAALENAPIIDLRDQWKSLFQTDPPAAYGPDLLRRRIAQHLQERALGGLSKPMQRMLDRLIETHLIAPSREIALPRQVQSGATLSRNWKGATHVVTVLDDGFSWNGKVWCSLSEIAREITGTRWNGPRFFGLRADKPLTADSAPALAPSQTKKAPNRKARANHGL